MSGFGKRMKRRLVREAARMQRAATAGGGQWRQPLRWWIESTERDLRSVGNPEPREERSADDHAHD